ncbi:hypothetical protein BM935_005135 [Escherichia coli]|nr:hypothetical protein [Escherichia coli]HCN0045640.1 hypothetical protein [Escherichia coli]
MGIFLSLLLQQRAPGGRPCSARSPLPVGCSPRPGRPWNTAAVVFLTARLCRESGLKGVHQKRATGWRTLSTTPAGSGKSARPVPAGRGTLTTGSVSAAPRQPAQ